MIFKREGRPSWYFQAQLPRGTYRQLSTGTPNKALALKIARTWQTLARDDRAWDVLSHVLNGTRSIGEIFDAYQTARGEVREVRRQLNDACLSTLLNEYLTEYGQSGVRPDTVDHVTGALRWLIPEGAGLRVSDATPEWLSEKLRNYPASASTRRKIRSEWNGFFTWLRDTKNILDRNPMDRVKAPAQRRQPIEFYERDEVQRIIGDQPNEERRALFALLYGSGTEVGTALHLTRADVDPSRKEVRVRGTKAHSRDRVVRVDDWAWPTFWTFVQNRISGLLFSITSRHTVSHWHLATVRALGMGRKYPIKNSRHHFAATHLRAGAPVHLVQHQLGHSTANLTLNTYGRYVPSQEDHERVQRQLEVVEQARLSAMGGAR